MRGRFSVSWVLTAREKPEAVRRVIGFLPGELKLDDFFTPAYLFDCFADLHELPREQRELLFDRFGITEFAHERVGTLSSGMKQKASLVIAIAHDPQIIIFDEPTNSLDVIAAKTVTDFLLELKKREKRSFFPLIVDSLNYGAKALAY